MLFINDVPITCINQAAIEYHVPATVIVSVLRTENGRVGQANRNKDGSFDLGPMQVNSRWLTTLNRYGYTQHDLEYNACANVTVGAWILASEIADGQTLWTGIGDYHSHTPYYNFKYQYQVKTTYAKLIQTVST